MEPISGCFWVGRYMVADFLVHEHFIDTDKCSNGVLANLHTAFSKALYHFPASPTYLCSPFLTGYLILLPVNFKILMNALMILQFARADIPFGWYSHVLTRFYHSFFNLGQSQRMPTSFQVSVTWFTCDLKIRPLRVA